MKVWIDDLRAPPDNDWHWAKTSGMAMWIISLARENEAPLEISFDHDLGGDDTAMPVAKMIEEAACRGQLAPVVWHIHSANPVGRANLKAALDSADRQWAKHTKE